MERPRPEPPRQPPRATPPRPLRPAPPPPPPLDGAAFRGTVAEPPRSPPAPCAAALAAVAASCGDAAVPGVQPVARRLLQVKTEQVLLLPPAPDEGPSAGPAQARLLPLRPELLLLPPALTDVPPPQLRALHVKAEKPEPEPGLEPSATLHRALDAAAARASRAAPDEKGRWEAEEALRDVAEGGHSHGLATFRDGCIKTEEPERPREDVQLGAEPSSNGLGHGNKEVLLAPPSSTFGPQQQDLRIPLTLHPVPPGARIQFQGPPPSELIRLTKVPLTPVPIKMQSLLEPSVKIETKDVPLTVLPSDAGIR